MDLLTDKRSVFTTTAEKYHHNRNLTELKYSIL